MNARKMAASYRLEAEALLLRAQAIEEGETELPAASPSGVVVVDEIAMKRANAALDARRGKKT